MTTAKLSTIDLRTLRRDLGTHSRIETNEQVAKSWSEYLDELPEVHVFDDGRQKILADGFTRVRAYEIKQLWQVPCQIHRGTLRDAVLFSIESHNDKGPQPRGDNDKILALKILLADPEWSHNSSRWIAERCGFSHTKVNKAKKSIEQETGRRHETVRVHRNGKVINYQLPSRAATAMEEAEADLEDLSPAARLERMEQESKRLLSQKDRDGKTTPRARRRTLIECKCPKCGHEYEMQL